MKLFRSLITAFLILFLPLISLSQTGLHTNLPTVYLTTTGGVPITSKENWVTGTITIVGDGVYPGRAQGAMDIRGRGNSTWEGPTKKPYRIRLPSGSSDRNLLGMPSDARNWVLLANFFDISLMRNALAFETSKFLGFSYSPPFRFVDVFLNGNYIGNYTMTDHIQVENNRVEVEALSADDTDPTLITGGYFVQEDTYARDEEAYFQTARAGQYEMKYPDFTGTSDPKFVYISNYIKDYENRLFADNFLDPTAGYNAVVDRESQVNWQIVNEISANRDSYQSVYLYKKRANPKLYFGPIWDHDKSFNNHDGRADMAYRAISEVGSNSDKIKRMLLDPDFVSAISDRWKELRSAGIYAHIDAKITEFATKLDLSKSTNFEVWGAAPTAVNSTAYQNEIAIIRRFWKRKVGFLDYHLTREIFPQHYYRIGNFGDRTVISSNEANALSLQKDSLENAGFFRDWLLTPVGASEPGYYSIRNRANQKVLTRSGNSVTLNDMVGQPSVAQMWKIENVTNQSYATILTHPSSGPLRALQRVNTTELTLNSDLNNMENSGSKRWFFVNVDVEDTSLPVVLSEFSANEAETKVTLNWEVTSVNDFSYFEVERSSADRREKPEVLGRVYPRENAVGSYQHIDEAPLFGLNYYRLKMVDIDGTHRYSDYVSVRHTGVADFVSFPVPASTSLQISFDSRVFTGEAFAVLYNNLGSVVRSQPFLVKKGENKLPLEVGGLSSGIYHLKIRMEHEILNKQVLISK
jgi:hypothetical protein